MSALKSTLILVSIVTGVLNLSCTSIKKRSVSQPSFLKGPLPVNASAEEVENNLARRVVIVPGDDTENQIIITAILQTEPLIRAQEMKLVKEGKSSKLEAQATIQNTVRQIVDEKTCFLVDIKSVRGGSRADLQHWRGRLEQPRGRFQTVVFKKLRSLASERDPRKDYVGLGHISHLNTEYSLACTPRPVNLLQPLRLHFSAKWDVSSSWHTLTWQ